MIDSGVVDAVVADMAQDDEPAAPEFMNAEEVFEPQPVEEIKQSWTVAETPLEQPAPRPTASLKAEVEQLREAVEGPRLGRASTATDSRVDEALARISSLESRLEEQEKAIRQMLALLVDWVERDDKDMAYLRGSRAA